MAPYLSACRKLTTTSLFYHSIVLSLNRHFINTSTSRLFPTNQQAQSSCATSCDAVIAITRQFRNQSGEQKSPIILLYALMMVAITIATASGNMM